MVLQQRILQQADRSLGLQRPLSPLRPKSPTRPTSPPQRPTSSSAYSQQRGPATPPTMALLGPEALEALQARKQQAASEGVQLRPHTAQPKSKNEFGSRPASRGTSSRPASRGEVGLRPASRSGRMTRTLSEGHLLPGTGALRPANDGILKPLSSGATRRLVAEPLPLGETLPPMAPSPETVWPAAPGQVKENAMPRLVGDAARHRGGSPRGPAESSVEAAMRFPEHSPRVLPATRDPAERRRGSRTEEFHDVAASTLPEQFHVETPEPIFTGKAEGARPPRPRAPRLHRHP